jgi:transposase
MMGPRQVDQAALFYEFSLERHVPATHLLRSIDRFVDLSDVRSHLAPFYSSTGRPSIDPAGCCWLATATAFVLNGGCARRFT